MEISDNTSYSILELSENELAALDKDFRILELSERELAELDKPVHGSGGFQSLLRRLQEHLDREQSILRVTPDLAALIVRYSGQQYGSGGFQERLRRIVQRMEESGDYSPDIPSDVSDAVAGGEEIVVEDNLGETAEDADVNFYEISSYGADYTIDSLVKRVREESIVVPPFQRGFVWTHRQASRFIESLLLGLPVPGVFLSKEPGSNKLLVIDGQQRLRTLWYFYDGHFAESGKAFALRGVDVRFEGKTYTSLDSRLKRHLDDSILHATVIKQERPAGDDSSIFYVFERINTGGTQLAAQEIRKCVYQGQLSDLLEELNDNAAWRSICGPRNARMRDRELILRFLALYYTSGHYRSPMKRFLNNYMSANRNLTLQSADELRRTFGNTIEAVHDALGASAFKRVRVLNAAVFDAVMVGLANRLALGSVPCSSVIKQGYDALLANSEFQDASQFSTADETNVARRLRFAIEAFAE